MYHHQIRVWEIERNHSISCIYLDIFGSRKQIIWAIHKYTTTKKNEKMHGKKFSQAGSEKFIIYVLPYNKLPSAYLNYSGNVSRRPHEEKRFIESREL